MKRGTAVALGLGISIGILFTSACASPQAVRLAPLAPEASTEARAAWRRAMQGQVVEAPVPGIPGMSGSQPGQTFLLLADGTRITDPRDLLPVVGTETTSGRAALRAAETRELSDRLTSMTTGFTAVGLGVSVGGVLALSSVLSANDPAREQALLQTGGAISAAGIGLLGVAAVLSGPAFAVREELAIERATAFAAYNASLDAQLEALKPPPPPPDVEAATP
jgi:hypothetical protein